MKFAEFQTICRKAKRQIKRGENPKQAMTSVMVASWQISGSTSEINLAIAFTVQVELLVQPEHVDPADANAAFRCIGSNGRYPMPIREWEYEG